MLLLLPPLLLPRLLLLGKYTGRRVIRYEGGSFDVALPVGTEIKVDNETAGLERRSEP